MTDVAIRPALPSERMELEALQRRASLGNPGDREVLLANPDAIGLPAEQLERGRVFVAENAGSISGFGAILPREDGDSELDALFVEPGMWRRGVGTKLVDYLAEVALAEGSSAIYVVGNPHAQNFYAACGFDILGTTRARFGQGLLMRKSLSHEA